MAEVKKIFIAEDDRFFRELYQMVLGEEGYQIVFAITGKEALEKFPGADPDLIILDVLMPEMNGYEVCSKLRELPEFAFTPILMLTGLSADEDKIKGYHVGADDFLTKPFSPKVFRERVRNILERSRAKKAGRPTAAPDSIAPTGEIPAAGGAKPAPTVRQLHSGEDLVQGIFGGVLPHGVNILILGPLGSGKSSFSRYVLAQGLKQNQKCMFICLDDSPARIRQELSAKYKLDVGSYESQAAIRFIDAYSSSGGRIPTDERFSVTGALDLTDLSALVAEAAGELDQTEELKKGGRRVLDSISSLFLNFELPYIQRFIAYLARSGHFADVTTFFIVEQGACDEQALNNIKYLMDGVLEFKNEEQKFLARVQSLKWGPVRPEWLDITHA
jgi:CheY-like chemotaxis protein/KaiC/GvpD/RAD55 family RecA-like ATPase